MRKREEYIIPTLHVVRLSSLDAILMTGSLNGNTVIGDGGSAKDNGITSADVKDQGSYNVWDDDWQKP